MRSPERPRAHAALDIAGSAGSPPPSSGVATRTAAPSRHSRGPRFWQNETPQFILAKSMSCTQASAQAAIAATAAPAWSTGGAASAAPRYGLGPLARPMIVPFSREHFPVPALRIPSSASSRESAASPSDRGAIRRQPSPNRRKRAQICKIRCYFPCWQGIRRPRRKPFLTRSVGVDCR
jgi:hypothetical protein